MRVLPLSILRGGGLHCGGQAGVGIGESMRMSSRGRPGRKRGMLVVGRHCFEGN